VVDGVVNIPLVGRPIGCCPDAGRGRGPALRHFVAGPENHLAEVAVKAVLSGAEDGYNPLVLFGPSGSGKSHLALGLADAWKAHHRRRPLVCETAVDFARQLADAIEAQAAGDFRAQRRRAGLWVVEDIERLAGKQAAQLEFVVLLDDLVASGVRVLVTAAAAPNQIAGLAARLQSRLVAGLTVPLALPGPEARLAILGQLAALRELNLLDEAAEALAAGLCGTPSQLAGALVQLEMASTAESPAIDLKAAGQYLARRQASRRVELRAIAAATARHFSLRARDLRSPSRRQVVVRARGVAMYLARELTAGSLEQIGRFFGGRDHTTVLHGCRRTEELLEKEPAIRHAIQQVRQRVQIA
jgi:chromosomal replication initiator protein